MSRQKRRQMGLHADRPHAGAAAAVRDAEGLVQVEVADIRAEIAGPGQPDLRVQVGAVEIDLTAMGVHDVANVANAPFEDAVRRGIGDHHGREIVRMLLGLGRQVLDVDVACASQATTTTFMPAICADAGLVPCAEDGIRQTLRCASPRAA